MSSYETYSARDWKQGEIITESALDRIETQLENLSNSAWGTVTTFSGATSSVIGAPGLVPEAQIEDKDKFLTGGGTWGEVTNINADIITGILDSSLLPVADASTLGAVQIGETLEIDDGIVNVQYSSKEDFGCVKVGNNLEIDEGIIDINSNKILPDITNADDKKVLAVVNGEWQVVEVQSLNSQVRF